MLYGVQHVTRFRYGTPVDLAVHLAHLRPRELPWQRVLRASLSADPPASAVRHGTDDFGNGVTWLFHDAPHREFALTLRATVKVQAPEMSAEASTAPWEAVRAAATSDWRVAEFLRPSPRVPLDGAALAYASESFPAGCPVLAGLRELTRRIRADFAFRPGSTTVRTAVAQVMAQRAGVCQDFAHVMIAGLRALGLPARYVSGYLRTGAPPDGTRLRGADASHAWVSAWLGTPLGWAWLDPTNDCLMGDGHVTLGWGRDYGDVSPVQGVLLGGGQSSLDVGVTLQPLSEEAEGMAGEIVDSPAC